MAEEKAKLCPFCGNLEVYMFKKTNQLTGLDLYYVKCERCGACGPQDSIQHNAIVCWNHRVFFLPNQNAEITESISKSLPSFVESPMTESFVKGTCKPGTTECCRYLLLGKNGWGCAKLQPELKKHFDDRVARNDMNAIGDNCKGVLNTLIIVKEKK